jgi:hypothetical protein
VIRLLKPTGRFICISRMSPEEVLPLLEQFDIDEPFYTPWLIEVQATLKPKEYVLPSSLYRMGGNYNPQYPHPGGNENPPSLSLLYHHMTRHESNHPPPFLSFNIYL